MSYSNKKFSINDDETHGFCQGFMHYVLTVAANCPRCCLFRLTSLSVYQLNFSPETMFCKPVSLPDGIPTRLNNVNLIPQLFESDEEYFLPSNYELKRHDVLCGQVKAVGNERFRIIAEMRVQRYLNASCRREKVQIVTEMVDAVRQAGGNFVRLVQRDGVNQQWIDIGNLKAREKASHALRCCASRYQKSNTGTSDAAASPALEHKANDEKTKSGQKSKRKEITKPFYPEPLQKKPRRVSSGSFSPIISSEDDAISLKQSTCSMSLYDILLFNDFIAPKTTMLHDLRCEMEGDGSDALYRSMMLRPTVDLSMPPRTMSHAPSMPLLARDYSLIEASCGLNIHDEDLMDLFDFKEAIV
jgi:hypothetical protein